MSRRRSASRRSRRRQLSLHSAKRQRLRRNRPHHPWPLSAHRSSRLSALRRLVSPSEPRTSLPRRTGRKPATWQVSPKRMATPRQALPKRAQRMRCERRRRNLRRGRRQRSGQHRSTGSTVPGTSAPRSGSCAHSELLTPTPISTCRKRFGTGPRASSERCNQPRQVTPATRTMLPPITSAASSAVMPVACSSPASCCQASTGGYAIRASASW